MEPTKNAGHYRKDIYEIIRKMIGRDLAPDEHKSLKKELQGYLLEHGAALVIAQKPTPPVEHLLICKSCGMKEKAAGMSDFRQKKHQKFANQQS